MKNGDLKKYLDEFQDDAEVSMVLANPKERKLYEVVDILVVTGENNPILCICVGKESEMDGKQRNQDATIKHIWMSLIQKSLR